MNCNIIQVHVSSVWQEQRANKEQILSHLLAQKNWLPVIKNLSVLQFTVWMYQVLSVYLNNWSDFCCINRTLFPTKRPGFFHMLYVLHKTWQYTFLEVLKLQCKAKYINTSITNILSWCKKFKRNHLSELYCSTFTADFAQVKQTCRHCVHWQWNKAKWSDFISRLSGKLCGIMWNCVMLQC